MLDKKVIRTIWEKYLSEAEIKARAVVKSYRQAPDRLEQVLKLNYHLVICRAEKQIRKTCEDQGIAWKNSEWAEMKTDILSLFALKLADNLDCSELLGKSRIILDEDSDLLKFIENTEDIRAEVLIPEGTSLDRSRWELISCLRKIGEKMSYEEIVENNCEYYLNKLEKYHLSWISKDKLRGYFRYLQQLRIRNIPYNFIVQADTDAWAENFLRDLRDIIIEIKGKNTEIIKEPEKSILKPTGSSLQKISNADMIIIGNLLPDDDYYSADWNDSTTRTEKSGYNSSWKSCMEYFETRPEKNVFLYGPSNIIQGRIKNNQYMFYMFFKNKIYIGNMNEQEIYDAILDKLSSNKLDISNGFSDALKAYVDTVYPKALLKNLDFVNDLYDWMVNLAFEKNGHCRCLDENCIPYYHVNETFENIDNEFHQLVGLTEVKETFKEIGALCQSIQRGGTRPYLNMIFRGNPGTGKTTVARYVAKLFSSMGIIKSNKVITVMPSDMIAVYQGQTGPKTRKVIEKAQGGILFVDEAYLLDPNSSGNYVDTYREECIGELIKAMEKKDDFVAIFAGYPKEMDRFIKSNPGLNSRIGYTMEFKDYDNEQLQEIFKDLCRKGGYEYDDEVIAAVARKIQAAQFNDNFGNARSVENIYNQAVTESLKRNAADRKLQAEDVIIGKDLKSYEDLQEELDKKVGIKQAKEAIKEQVLSNKFCKDHGMKLPSSNNMVFVGNAGTGKTTTAKIFAEMLFSIGAAKSPKIKMITAKDLFARDVADKLNGYFREAMGGVLFIDEIYLLQSDRYICTEVISVMLEKLEEQREDITVILAGYDEEMKKFLDENQGLKSRLSITVHFNDFSEAELTEIFIQNCEESGMTLDTNAVNKFKRIIKKEKACDNFGNGRTVRNLFEQAFRRHAVRYYQDQTEDAGSIDADDIQELVLANGNGSTFGF